MLQELFRIPLLNLPIYSYGVMMVVGVLAAIHLAKFLARRFGLDGEVFVNAGILAVVTGVLGARLSHVIENIGQYTTITPTRSAWDNLVDAINIRSGGLTYYGGFLLAFPSLVIYALKKKLPLRLGMDIVAPCIVIGLAFGRIGCFLNGCCYGGACDLPWAVHFPYHSFAYEEEFNEGRVNVPQELQVLRPNGTVRLLSREELRTGIADEKDPVTKLPVPIENIEQVRRLGAEQHSAGLHPAQLYSALTAFLITGIVLCFLTLGRAPGRAFALMLMLEGSSRFVLEMLRVERQVIGRFSLSMLIGLGLAGLGLVLWLLFSTDARKESKPALQAARLSPKAT
jgi:phosphatidylglycerol:prolipoprotein diacylglycerol transferase